MTSQCPNRDRCGSCGWSHIPYEKQLRQKISDINGSFKLKRLDTRVEEILPSPVTEHYRNRMDFVIDFKRQVGLREKGKWWNVIDNHTCFLSDEKIEQLFAAVRQWVQSSSLSCFDRKALTGLLRYAVIRSTTIGETMVTIVTSTPDSDAERVQVRKELETLARGLPDTTLVWSVNSTTTDVSFGDTMEVISGSGYIEEFINGFRYRITPNAFFQTNSHAAALLQKTVLEFVGDASGKKILDLYCGSGFFGIALGKGGAVMGVESVPDAIRDAKMNAELNNIGIEFHEAKTESFDWGTLHPDVLILDPPRMGMHDNALADVLKNKPPRIVYISCNYKNFARELVLLKEHYGVAAMRAIDMFPHTPHVELITCLVRR